ncbi:hypothetical protein KCMC57_up54640 [Kitasatospora sp. CMC57]|uniref:ATP-grasp domain-containing protein n=1 Tax=Kitasatospora sp. CMC57 TaxID=3231513 RepID=A0AB33KB15_9ACTN
MSTDRRLLLAPRINETGLQLLTAAHARRPARQDRDRLAAAAGRHAAGAPLRRPAVRRRGAVVVDVGLLADGGWAVVEANPAWASGGYACDPDAVLDVVLRAAGPLSELRAADRPYCRELPVVTG